MGKNNAITFRQIEALQQQLVDNKIPLDAEMKLSNSKYAIALCIGDKLVAHVPHHPKKPNDQQ